MTTPLAQLRLDLANARAELRTAKDALDTAKAIATLNVSGKNDDERKKAAAIALIDNQHYNLALIALRDREFAVDLIEAQIATEEDALRQRELEARERLTEALRGKRTDNAVADAALDQFSRIEAAQRSGYQDDWYKQG